MCMFVFVRGSVDVLAASGIGSPATGVAGWL